jgi:hypothetical protein
LAALPAEVVTVGPQELELWTPQVGAAESAVTKNLYGWTFYDNGPAETPVEFRVPFPATRSYQLVGNGNALWVAAGDQTWGAIERVLLDIDPPYFGFGDLSRWFLRSHEPLTRGHASTFMITAPTCASFDVDDVPEIDEVTGDLIVRLEVPQTVEAAEYKVAYHIVMDHVPDRQLHRLSGENERTSEGTRAARTRKLVDTVNFVGATWIDARLLFRGEIVAAAVFDLPRLLEPNQRVAALKSLGEGYDKLRAMIRGDAETWRDDTRAEAGVSWLLTACGFQVFLTDLEKAKMSGSAPGGLADLAVFLPHGRKAAVIEVTSRDLMTAGKLVKLHDRAEAVREALAPLDVQVLAVICTGKESITDTERDEARRLSVAVVTRTDMSTLWGMAEDNRPPRECMDFIQAFLSPTGGSSSPRA